ncbi:prostaglandin reductase 1-like isoform X3 [Belonocnema kinseyi]|uniref:prostaglandin reductase 1-like isoform X3 n=1 Tax=Belonocnema kinseyi TaxID=2817044 RepID=UPI00143D3216|nr:prostaglandin reductase 1-like isoform X3 [Belonocnema kinseyi]
MQILRRSSQQFSAAFSKGNRNYFEINRLQPFHLTPAFCIRHRHTFRSFSTHTSTMVVGQKYIIAKKFEGEPQPTDLTLVEDKLPPIKDGEIFLEAEYFSIDPYMRPYVQNVPLGSVMLGCQIAKIIESKNPKFPVGQRIRGYYGWRTHTIINPDEWKPSRFLNEKPRVLPDFGHLSPSLGLGVLGMTGDTSYFGLLDICQPKAGETLVISGAAGAVGSHVGQIGKINGLRVIGIAGSDEKCNWLVKDLGFDHAINYKTENIDSALRKAAPKGVDCYFDNVGGDISGTVIYRMNDFGRISVCGSISSYNSDRKGLPKTKILQPAMAFKQLKMEGFIVTRWADRCNESFAQNMKWIQEGKLKYRETVTLGFENMFKAFVGMLNGENTGKAIVKVTKAKL